MEPITAVMRYNNEKNKKENKKCVLIKFRHFHQQKQCFGKRGLERGKTNKKSVWSLFSLREVGIGYFFIANVFICAVITYRINHVKQRT